MSTKTMKDKNNTLYLPHFSKIFPELPAYVFVAMLFADIGIILGATNALRRAGYLTLFQIHMTHWTSTLLGGLSVLMMGQIWYTFSTINKEKHHQHQLTLLPLGLWLLGMAFNYMAAWVDFNTYHPISFGLLLTSVSIYLVLLLTFFLKKEFRTLTRKTLTPVFLTTSVIWLWLGILFFRSAGETVSETLFIYSYIYGFFTMTLFGSLYHFLPRIYDQAEPSFFTKILNYSVLLGAGVLLTFERYLRNQGFYQFWFLRLIGAGLFAFSLLIFILWLGDFIYRASLSPSLAGLLVAMVIFSFFMFDTIMASAFPQWIPSKHIHFMFLGALLLTIISIGTRIVLIQFKGKSTNVDVKSWDVKEVVKRTPKIRLISMIGSVIGVGGVIFGFTIQVLGWFDISVPYTIVSAFGILLFFSLIFVELSLAYELRKTGSILTT